MFWKNGLAKRIVAAVLVAMTALLGMPMQALAHEGVSRHRVFSWGGITHYITASEARELYDFYVGSAVSATVASRFANLLKELKEIGAWGAAGAASMAWGAWWLKGCSEDFAHGVVIHSPWYPWPIPTCSSQG